MRIYLNGREEEIAPQSTVAMLLEELELSPELVTVTVNGLAVPRQDFASTVLGEGSRVEVILFLGGGS